MVLLNFNAQQYTPLEERGAVPAGWYNVTMDKSEAKPTKDGAGMYLECQFAVMDGVHKGARFWTRLNIRNNNPQAVEIAYRELSAIAHACGVMQVQDSTMLHNIPLKVKVKLRKAEGYDDQNEITAYKPASHQVETVGSSPFGAGPAGGFAPQQIQTQQPAQMPQQQWQPPQQAQQPWQQNQTQAAPQQQVQQPPQQMAQQQPPQQQQAPQPAWQQPPQQQAPQQAVNAPQAQQQQPQQTMAAGGAGGVPPWLQNNG